MSDVYKTFKNILAGRGRVIRKGTEVKKSHPQFDQWLARGLIGTASPPSNKREVHEVKKEAKAYPGMDLSSPVAELSFVNPAKAEALSESEILTIGDIGSWGVDDLVSINGIGPGTAGSLIEAHDTIKAGVEE